MSEHRIMYHNIHVHINKHTHTHTDILRFSKYLLWCTWACSSNNNYFEASGIDFSVPEKLSCILPRDQKILKLEAERRLKSQF